MKREIDTLDATPSKRLFLSIIADYDLNKSLCELIDNALDLWVRSGRAKAISISVVLDSRQQTIAISDDAGGLKRAEMPFIVAPGQTGTNPNEGTIGIFGVGSKRAVLALAQDVKIRTRHCKARETFQVEFDDAWIENDEWALPLYQVDNIVAGTTIVELQRLRMPITDESINLAKEHLGATYAKFITNTQVTISINDQKLKPQFFGNWAYPPKYSPRRYLGTLTSEEYGDIAVDAVAGLINESSPATGEYGVYVYCNDRLIARALRNLEVGFARGLAGLPHPKVSLVRVLVSLSGDARAMPWNSSKSDINTKHEVFRALHGWLVQTVKDYAALSRIWMGDWPSKVFKYTKGKIIDVEVSSFPSVKKSFIPPLPKSRLRYADVLATKNRLIANRKPWTRGLYEAVVAADVIERQHLEQKNRIAFIVLDSTLEIAFKEYLVNESGVSYSDHQLLTLFSNRNAVQKEMRKYISLPKALWQKIEHYYRLRNKLIHERATVGISDAQLGDFRAVVEGMLSRLFRLKFQR